MTATEEVLRAIRELIDATRVSRGAGMTMNLTVRLQELYGADAVRQALADDTES